METLKNNVAIFSKELPKNKRLIIENINLILEDIRERSINTYNTYKSNYEEFFRLLVGKEMDFISWEDFLEIEYEDILRYRNLLKKSNSNKTINLKIASISSLYDELYKMNREVDKVIIDVKPLSTLEENNSYGSLTEGEMEGLFNYCESLNSRMKPIQKKMFFKLAYITAIRSGALLQLKWKDIAPIDNLEGYVITLRDKGKINQTPITKEVYDSLLEMEEIEEDRVFPTTSKSLRKVLKEYCESVGIDQEGRNIVLHSIKKASVDKVYAETGDLLATAHHAHHNGINLVYNTYQGRNNTMKEKPSYRIFGQKVDYKEELEKFSKEELIEALIKGGDSQKILNLLKEKN